MKYFITGASGFIGGEIAKQLKSNNHEVVALVRNPDPQKTKSLTDLGVEIAEGDITDKESMRNGMSGVDGVFHVAAWYKVGVKGREKAYQINVQGTKNVLELMKELQIPKGVYTSTLAVFSDTGGEKVDENYRFEGEHLSEYDRTKWIAHYQIAQPLIEEGLPLVIVMPGVVYGPWDTSQLGDTFRDYLKKDLPIIPKQTEFCWGHVEDIARGHVLAMEKGKVGDTYIIAGPNHKLTDVFDLAEQITGITAPKIRMGPGIMKLMSGIMKVVGSVVPLPPEYSAESLRVMAGTTYLGSNEKARRELGYAVRPIEEGMEETLKHFMKEMDVQPKK